MAKGRGLTPDLWLSDRLGVAAAQDLIERRQPSLRLQNTRVGQNTHELGKHTRKMSANTHT